MENASLKVWFMKESLPDYLYGKQRIEFQVYRTSRGPHNLSFRDVK